MKLDDIAKIVNSDLNAVNDFILKEVDGNAAADSLPIVNYLIKKKGKQIRPLLNLLTYRCIIGHQKPVAELTQQVAALELIHIGSLIHDDVIDEANQRRGQASINLEWGNSAAVSIGTYFYSIAISLLSQLNRPYILTMTAKTVQAMCNSELTQLAKRYNLGLTTPDYLKLISNKTALLFQTNTVASAHLSECDEKTCELFSKLGFEIGLLFQLTDDFLDYFGDDSNLNKPIGQDFKQGQVTLPLIMLKDVLPDTTTLFKTPFTSIKQLMANHGISEKVKVIIEHHQHTITEIFKTIPDNDYKKALQEMCLLISQRINLITA
mgnify:CR=1 FL=1